MQLSPHKELTHSNYSVEEWKHLKVLATDITITIKAADRGSTMVFGDISDYIHEVSRQYHNKNV